MTNRRNREQHSDQIVSDGLHSVPAYRYADQTERVAATGFETWDLHKMAIQLDDNSLWLLVEISPPVWSAVGSGGGGGGSGVAISAGTQIKTTGTVLFSNSNGVSFGLSNGTLTASHNGITNQSSVVFSNANNITFGLNASTLTASASYPAQTAYVFSNSNGLTFGTNGSTITASHNGITSQTNQTANVVVPSAGTQTATSGTVVFSNSNGITFGMSGSSRITASHNGITSQTAFVLSNSNGISFGTNASTITASYTVPTQTAQTIGGYAANNTTGQSSSTTIDARSLTFRGNGGASVGFSNGSVIIDVNTAGGGALTNINVSAGTTSGNLSAFVLSNSNNVSFGLNGSTITGSASFAQSVQTSNIVVPSAGTQTATSGTVVYSNSNNITFGMSGSSRITASYNFNLSAGTTSGNINSISFSNGSGVSFGLNAGTLTASVAAQSAQTQNVVVPSAGTQTATSGTVVFANSNGLTFGMSGSSQITGSYTVPTQTAFVLSNSNGISFGTNGSTITASYTVPTQSVQTIGAYGVSNTTLSTSGTIDARSLSFQGAGIASVGVSNGSVIVSVPSGAPSPVNFSAGTTSGNLGSVVFSNSNGVSFGLNGSTITASVNAGGGGPVSYYGVGNTTQNSSTTLNGTVSLNGLGAMTVGYSNGSIQLSAPSVSSLVGVGGVVVSSAGSTVSISGMNYNLFDPYPGCEKKTGNQGNASLHVQPITIPNMIFSKASMGLNWTGSTNTVGSVSFSHFLGFYTNNAGTLSLHASGSTTTAITQSGTNTSAYHGNQWMTMGLTTTLSSGPYWIGMMYRTSTGGASASNYTFNQLVASNVSNIAPPTFGAGTNATNAWIPGQGVYSASTAALPSSIGFSQINGTASVVYQPPLFVLGT